MKLLKNRLLQLGVLLVTAVSILNACNLAASQLKDKADEERLLKPGALDSQLTGVYDTYSFKFLGKYKITHQFPRNTDGCRYAQRPTLGVNTGAVGEIYDVTDIFEQDNHTWQISSKPDKPFNIDRYTRPEWTATNGLGKTNTFKGFTPMCFESWGGTSHVLAVKLFKKSVEDWRTSLTTANPNGKFSEVRIGNNLWMVQTADLAPRGQGNTVGGAHQSWTLPIGDTGYTLTMQFGANLDSLKYPEAHAQMQAIFRHLIESVKIEPISTDAK